MSESSHAVIPEAGRRIAVIGGGVAGLTAAYLLQKSHNVDLYERNDYVGGHTRTLTVPAEEGTVAVDTGFIVMNHKNYPLFTRLLERLRVPLADSDMSFSFRDEASGYEYAGTNLRGLFASRGSVVSPRHWKMIADILRFNRRAPRALSEGNLAGQTLAQYLRGEHFGRAFVNNYLLAMGAAIWSSPPRDVGAFPAEPYLHFFANHGLLQLKDRPQWRYVVGGSRRYVEAILASFRGRVFMRAGIARVSRGAEGVEIAFHAAAPAVYDHVVIAAHADEALRLLADPSTEESELLGAWRYQDNDVVLHTDETAMPRARAAWASWNFTRAAGAGDDAPVSVTYHMNRLQRLATRKQYFVTLNRARPAPAEHVINRTVLTHPVYSFAAMATHPRLAALNGSRRTSFCGSYFGYGFHEDAVRSGVRVAEAFGAVL